MVRIEIKEVLKAFWKALLLSKVFGKQYHFQSFWVYYFLK